MATAQLHKFNYNASDAQQYHMYQETEPERAVYLHTNPSLNDMNSRQLITDIKLVFEHVPHPLVLFKDKLKRRQKRKQLLEQCIGQVDGFLGKVSAKQSCQAC